MGKLTTRLGACALIFFLSASLASAKIIVFLGDSITAGLGVGKDRAYPALIAQKIREANLPYDVINAGVSGDTSADGLRRTDWVLQQKVDVLVIALGANDGLRGLPTTVLETNLQAIIAKAKAKNPQTRIIIAGMRMPPNLGADYEAKFQRVFGPSQKRTTRCSFHFCSRMSAEIAN